ncbi:MAG TPA: lytic transglycosylase domain-containing protein [Metalysinibacillus sp.]
MDIKSMGTMLQIQALQTLGSTQSNPLQADSSSSYFSSMIQEMMQNYSQGNMFGGVQSMAEANQAPTTYLDALRYQGDTTLPPSMMGMLNSSAMQNNPQVAQILQSLSTPSPTTDFSQVMGSATFTGALEGANKYAAIIKKASTTYGVPEKLIAAIMKQESNFNPNVVSYAGAQGLMQLMPGTARHVGVTNPFDHEQNIMGATKYISQMLKQHGNDPTIALAAYNAGPGNVAKYGGIPPFKETQNYVKNVLGYYRA